MPSSPKGDLGQPGGSGVTCATTSVPRVARGVGGGGSSEAAATAHPGRLAFCIGVEERAAGKPVEQTRSRFSSLGRARPSNPAEKGGGGPPGSRAASG
jgi:hypothetical protein